MQHDLYRFFTMQNLLITPEQVDIFYSRVLRNKPFDLKALNQIITAARRDAIIDSVSVKVSGMSEEHRRTKFLTQTNSKLMTSLTPFSAEPQRSNKKVTKAYQTDFINTDLLVKALRKYIRD